MFSGIVQALGRISAIEKQADNMRLQLISKQLDLSEITLGESIAVNGVCLTIIAKNKHCFSTDVSEETIKCSNFAQLQPNSLVNLEKALRLQQGINGHLVSGHIDTIATITEIKALKKHHIFTISIPKRLLKYCILKGSICINGVSLTINAIKQQLIAINIIPHTLQSTNFSTLAIGETVNVEVDMLAKYIEKICPR